MAIQLNISNYQNLVSSITTMLSSGQYKSIIMTVYHDSYETNIASDLNGSPVQNRAILSTTTKSEYFDENGNLINGTVTICFADGSAFVSTEAINSYWYSLSGVSILNR